MSSLLTDLVLSPFAADTNEMVAAARIADNGGFDGLWTFDHFSGVVVDAEWSRDAFVILGAIAAVTQRATLGVLVANIVNRHAAQLASATNTLQALAPGRVMAGIGTGAGPGSSFAPEHEAIGRQLESASSRRGQLVEYLAAFKTAWADDRLVGDNDSKGMAGTVDRTHERPPIVVGASSLETIRVAAQHSDGVNIRAAADLAEKVAAARDATHSPDFEISVFDRLDLSHPLGGDLSVYTHLGIDRRTLVIDPPYDLERLAEISGELQAQQ